jgi:hypothetical protein
MKIASGFVTPWKYSRSVEWDSQVFHLWECTHIDGYTAYQLTLSVQNNRVKQLAPSGPCHFTSIRSLERRTGVTLH